VRRGDDFEFAFDAIAETVKANFLRANRPSLEEKRKEVSRRRNTLEEEIRSFLYRSSVRLGDEVWSVRFSTCVSANRKTQLGILNRREAFSKTNSPLYFMELLKFVQSCGEFNDSAISLDQILSAMHAVNLHRIDAHAKDITEADYTKLIQSMEILEGIFLAP
jgi:hypothetical protein